MLLASSLPHRPVAQVPLESKPSAREAGPSLAAPKHAKKGAVAPVVGRVPITVAQAVLAVWDVLMAQQRQTVQARIRRL